MPERPWCQYNKYKEGSYPMLAEMNVLNLRGELTDQQAAFLAPRKPEIELFDLQADPHEMKNLALDSAYADVRESLLSELSQWRTNVIQDTEEISPDWRGTEYFPSSCPVSTVDEWVFNTQDIDFDRHGWPAWYPTRTLKEWVKARALWEPYVMRSAEADLERPVLTLGQKRKKK